MVLNAIYPVFKYIFDLVMIVWQENCATPAWTKAKNVGLIRHVVY